MEVLASITEATLVHLTESTFTVQLPVGVILRDTVKFSKEVSKVVLYTLTLHWEIRDSIN